MSATEISSDDKAIIGFAQDAIKTAEAENFKLLSYIDSNIDSLVLASNIRIAINAELKSYIGDMENTINMIESGS